MDLKRVVRNLLPDDQRGVLEWDHIPWSYVKNCHLDLPSEPLAALFDAYCRIDTVLDLDTIVKLELPEGSWGCMRCGHCCSSMQPGPVRHATYRRWHEAGAPVAWFYSPRGRAGKNPVYRCWYHNGVRLRICPFLFLNLADSRPICSIYHMGDDLRPPVCSKYVPLHETCTAKQIDPEPWESN